MSHVEQRTSIFLAGSILMALPGFAGAGGPVFTDLSASARDARIVVANPAGMTQLDSTAWRTGLVVYYSENTWETESSNLGQGGDADDDNTLYIPALYYVRPLGDRWRIGASLSATSGMGDDGNDDSVTRYLSKDWSVGSFTFMPAVAYRLNEAWSVGAGVGVNYTEYSWEAAVFNGLLQPDGEIELEADDINLNYVLSLHWKPAERTRFGLSYRSEYEPEMEDRPDYSNVDPDRQADGDISLDITMPRSVLAGMHHDFGNGHWVSVDLLWLELSEFNIESAVVGEGGEFGSSVFELDDTWLVTAGWGMALNPSWEIGLGLLFSSDPIDDDNRSVLLRVDSIRGIGASVEHHRENGVTIGANISYLDTGDAPVETADLPIVGQVRGEFSDRTDVLFEVFVSW